MSQASLCCLEYFGCPRPLAPLGTLMRCSSHRFPPLSSDHIALGLHDQTQCFHSIFLTQHVLLSRFVRQYFPARTSEPGTQQLDLGTHIDLAVQ
ncbi:hypothetical protein I7I48_03829 [Histoplasma ohiense]|nr:hypothetical protein I7I48_03829 [Histoplasma ohiense (nom. inval.)]